MFKYVFYFFCVLFLCCGVFVFFLCVGMFPRCVCVYFFFLCCNTVFVWLGCGFTWCVSVCMIVCVCVFLYELPVLYSMIRCCYLTVVSRRLLYACCLKQTYVWTNQKHLGEYEFYYKKKHSTHNTKQKHNNTYQKKTQETTNKNKTSTTKRKLAKSHKSKTIAETIRGENITLLLLPTAFSTPKAQ